MLSSETLHSDFVMVVVLMMFYRKKQGADRESLFNAFDGAVLRSGSALNACQQ